MVRVGRIVVLVALIIAALVAPQLRTLDQAYQYVQEYTGFIYPGTFLIFFCGLFWRQASANAAFWTAILTIPIGIVFKIFSPEMPFILRIGYVFMILSIVMVGLSLLDKSQQKVNVAMDEKYRKRTLQIGWTMISIASITGIVTAFFVIPYHRFAPEAIYVLVVGFILTGAILIFNASAQTMNVKGIITDKGLFRTSVPFNIAAIGICGVLAILYYLFW
jgi:SSS family solute:Na+ symporter